MLQRRFCVKIRQSTRAVPINDDNAGMFPRTVSTTTDITAKTSRWVNINLPFYIEAQPFWEMHAKWAQKTEK